jgi:Na+/melibiose symporter-like transporter
MDPPPLPIRKTSRVVTVGFWVLWAINAIIAGIVLFFFFWGLEDGTVSSFNILVWLAMVAAVSAAVAGSLWLRAIGKAVIAIPFLLILAIPGVLLGLFFLVLIIANPRWN